MIERLLWPFIAALPSGRGRIRSGLALRLAQKHGRRGRPERADQLFEQALSYGLTDSRPYVQYALALLERGEASRAEELLSDAAEVEPASPVPLVFLGLAHLDAGKPADAHAVLQRAARCAPGNLLPSTCLALVAMRVGKPGQAARQLLQQGIADNLPVRARLLAEVEKHLCSRGCRPDLENVLPRAADEPDAPRPAKLSPRAAVRKAEAAMRRGRYKTALALLDSAAGEGRAGDELHLFLAGAHMGLGNWQEAAARLASIPPDGPLGGPALFYAGVCNCLLGRPREARELLDKAAATGKTFDFEEVIHYYHGLCLLAEGQELPARQDLELALDADWGLLTRRLEAVLKLEQRPAQRG